MMNTLQGKARLTEAHRRMLQPFGEALSFTDLGKPSSGDQFLRIMKQEGDDISNIQKEEMIDIIHQRSQEELRRITSLLQRSGRQTPTLFQKSRLQDLSDIRDALGPPPPIVYPHPWKFPGTDLVVPQALARRLQEAPHYHNTNIRSDLEGLKKGRGRYVDLSLSPVYLHNFTEEGYLNIAPLIGESRAEEGSFQLLFALSLFGELRVAVHNRWIFHSSLFGPTVDLLIAGNIYIKNGKVVTADVGSSHFESNDEESLRLLKRVLQAMRIPGAETVEYDLPELRRMDIPTDPQVLKWIGKKALYLKRDANKKLREGAFLTDSSQIQEAALAYEEGVALWTQLLNLHKRENNKKEIRKVSLKLANTLVYQAHCLLELANIPRDDFLKLVNEKNLRIERECCQKAMQCLTNALTHFQQLEKHETIRSLQTLLDQLHTILASTTS